MLAACLAVALLGRLPGPAASGASRLALAKVQAVAPAEAHAEVLAETQAAVTAEAETDMQASTAGQDRPPLVEVSVPLNGADARLAAIAAVVTGASFEQTDGTTATFLVPPETEDAYRRLLGWVFSPRWGADGEPCSRPPVQDGESAPERRQIPEPFDEANELIVRFHRDVPPELAEVLAVVYGARILDRIPSLNAYLFSLPENGCSEDLQELLLLSPLVSSVEPNAPVHPF